MKALTERVLEPEAMDDPSLDAVLHVRALEGLERLNFWSDSAGSVWAEIRAFARRKGLRSLRVLDIATGAGDLPLALWRKARREGLDLRIDGCDKSPQAVAHAVERASRQNADVRFFQCDISSQDPPGGYDVALASLFLHHLPHAGAVRLLRQMAGSARLVVVNDLERTRAGYVLAFAGTRLFSRCPVVHDDGLLSVRAAFTRAEASALAREAGLTGAGVKKRWPERYLIVWEKQ